MQEIEEFKEELTQPSKTQRKRDVEALVDLAKRLIELDASKLANMNIPSSLLEAIEQGKTIQTHAAKKRQFKFIAKMLYDIDTTAIRQLFEMRDQQSQKGVNAFHHIEALRDKLISGGKPALTTFLTSNPQADRQKVHQLIRRAIQEEKAGKPSKSARFLFRYLKDELGFMIPKL